MGSIRALRWTTTLYHNPSTRNTLEEDIYKEGENLFKYQTVSFSNAIQIKSKNKIMVRAHIEKVKDISNTEPGPLAAKEMMRYSDTNT